MRTILSAAVAIGLCLPSGWAQAQSQAEAKESIPGDAATLIGGLAGLSLYTAHVALGKIYRADNSSRDLLDVSYRDSGGILGGGRVAIRQMEAIFPLLNESEKASLEQMLEGQKLIVKQCEALRELIQVWVDGDDSRVAEARFKAARTECGAMIMELLGLSEDLVE